MLDSEVSKSLKEIKISGIKISSNIEIASERL